METFRKFITHGCVLLASGLVLLAGLIALGYKFAFNRSDWAAWVQAVGSIAALAVAIFIMARQSKAAITLAAKTDHAALVRRTAAVSALMHNCHRSVYAAMTQLEGKLQEHDDVGFILAASTPWSEMLDGARASLGAVPLHELGTVDLVISSIGMLECILFLNNTLADWRSAGVGHFDVEQAKKIAANYKSQADALIDLFQREQTNLGAV